MIYVAKPILTSLSYFVNIPSFVELLKLSSVEDPSCIYDIYLVLNLFNSETETILY